MRENIPEFLWNLLTEQYGEELAEKISDGYVAERAVTLRVNRLKATPEEIKTQLSQAGIAYEAVDWSEDALIICGAREESAAQRVHSGYGSSSGRKDHSDGRSLRQSGSDHGL